MRSGHLDVKTLNKTEVHGQELAELACSAIEGACLPARKAAREKTRQDVLKGIASDCHDLIFAAYDKGKLVGWLALYEMTDLKIAQIWDWHPTLLPGEKEGNVANALTEFLF